MGNKSNSEGTLPTMTEDTVGTIFSAEEEKNLVEGYDFFIRDVMDVVGDYTSFDFDEGFKNAPKNEFDADFDKQTHDSLLKEVVDSAKEYLNALKNAREAYISTGEVRSIDPDIRIRYDDANTAFDNYIYSHPNFYENYIEKEKPNTTLEPKPLSRSEQKELDRLRNLSSMYYD